MLEADFIRFYGLDLGLEIHTSPRRTLSLVQYLPPESALLSKQQGGLWTQETELLAEQVEILHEMTRVLLKGFGAKKHNIPKGLAIPRPWTERAGIHHDPTKPRRKATVKETVSIIGKLMGGPHG